MLHHIPTRRAEMIIDSKFLNKSTIAECLLHEGIIIFLKNIFTKKVRTSVCRLAKLSMKPLIHQPSPAYNLLVTRSDIRLSSVTVHSSQITQADSSTPACLSRVPMSFPRAPMSFPRVPMSLPREPMSLPREPMSLPREPMSLPREPMSLPREPMSLPREPMSHSQIAIHLLNPPKN
jgi:hypothetical protein